MSFKTQIEDLIGSVGDDDLISTSIQDIGAEIVNILPLDQLLPIAKTASVTSSGLTVADKRVIGVDKDDLPAEEVPANEKARYNDTGSIYAASNTNPIYYIEDETVYVNGTAGSGATAGVLHYIPKIPTSDGSTAIVHGGTASVNFPLEAERLLVLGGSIRCLQRLMADKTDSLPSDISEPVLGEITESLPSFTAPSAFVLIPTPANADVDFSSVPSSPSFVSPIYSSPTLGSVGSISLPSAPVAPVSPSFTYTSASVSDIPQPIISISDMATMSESAPSYVPPILTLGTVPTISDLTISSAAPVSPISPSYTTPDISSTTVTNIGAPPTYTAPTDALLNAQNLIDNDKPASSYDAFDLIQSEDLELLQATLNTFQAEIQRAQADIQNELNDFNKENVAYQGKLQEAIQQAQISSREAEQEANLKLQKEQQEYSAKLQKFQHEVSEYQANVAKEVQQYQQNLEGDLRVWQAERQTDLQKYGSDIQSALNSFNEDNVVYQQDVQRKVQNLQKDTQVAVQNAQQQYTANKANMDKDTQVGLQNALRNYEKGSQEYQAKMSKYQAEISSYQAEVNATIQTWVNEEWNQNFQKYQTDYTNSLQNYSADIQKETASFGSSLSVYQQDIQKALQEYQSETGYDMSKYSAEVQSQTSRFASDLQKNTETFRTSMERYVNELQKVTESNQSKLSKYGADIQNYSSKSQKHGMDYQWKQGQYQQLKAEYTQGLQNLISGSIPQQQGV